MNGKAYSIVFGTNKKRLLTERLEFLIQNRFQSQKLIFQNIHLFCMFNKEEYQKVWII